ncbi:DUF7344 domain-containing protein [Halostella litorea]|uniref:DUF7344 domain-containing protein n=1 Tax=Halostella litorea TaxID=2528831 RepID=UPI0010922E47|nr:hypothetical protein [Halostella litorea]
MSQSTHAAEETGPETLTEDERHRLLSAPQRRFALDALADRTVPLGVEELAAAVAAPPDSGTADGRTVRRTATALHHNHLPAMDDAGVIDYDAEANAIESCNVCPAALLD